MNSYDSYTKASITLLEREVEELQEKVEKLEDMIKELNEMCMKHFRNRGDSFE